VRRFFLSVQVLVLLLSTSLRPIHAKLRFPFKAPTSTTCPPDATLEEIAAGVCSTTSTAGQILVRLMDLPGMQIPWNALQWMKQVVLYQPPVGIVALWTLGRLVTSGRLFRWDQQGDASEQALTRKAHRLDRHSGRALDLDADDLEYQQFGGVERVRRRLVWKALEEQQVLTLAVSSDTDTDAAAEEATFVAALMHVLKVSFPSGGSHADNIRQLLQPMIEAEQAKYVRTKQHQRQPQGGGGSSKLNERRMSHGYNKDTERLLEIALQTAELRMLDGLLRLTRDRLLRTSFRLSRTVDHWKGRVQNQSLMWPFIRDMMAESMEGDRMRLAFAQAAYQAEIVRLGHVVTTLTERPVGMEDSYLQKAVQKTLAMEVVTKPARTTSWSHLRRLPNVSNWALRFNTDGRGKFTVQKYEDSLSIGGQGALDVLLEADASQQEWLQAAHEWSKQARSMIYDILEEALETSVQSTDQEQAELERMKTSWLNKDYGNLQDVAHYWNFISQSVRDIHLLRRVGDGKSVKWKDANFVHWFRQWDLLGIPSVVLQIYLASVAHQKLLPHWPKMKAVVQESYQVTNEIIQTRFWLPVRDLFMELMYRPSTKLFTGIAVEDEETSLDFMLRDLDFGDGTPEGRHEAILKATRQYESDMKTGLMRHALGGRLVRLILIQVQQLKVGMLHAADTADVLLQANRFNFQLLAIIPAIVIVTVGTKAFYRFLFSVRTKGLRPMRSVHSEMTEYLNRLESILLLANKKGGSSAIQVLSKSELGEFVLNLYDYLVLLDYSSPQPFPGWQCDGIHQSITAFLGPQGSMTRLGLEDQVRLIDQVKRKHVELGKHL
jgi:nuclear-control-of-ATPase protein 2